MPDLTDSLGCLSQYYLGCMQEETLRLLRLTSNKRGTGYVTPAFKQERLLHDAHDVLEASALSSSERQFIKGVAPDQGPDTTEQDRLFYGYPTYVDDSHRVLPFLFVELRAEFDEDGEDLLRLRRQEEHTIYINHQVLRGKGYSPEDIAHIQNQVESEVGSFAKKLDTLVRYFSEEAASANWRDAFPLPRLLSAGLYPSALLFQSSYGSYTYNLERDLRDLRNWDHLRQKVEATALGPLLHPDCGRTRSFDRRPAEVLRLNERQERAVRSARTDPVAVITGPPGTGKSQVVVNLLAEAVFSGEPVLFASKNNKAVDVVRKRMRKILGEEHDFVLRLGSKRRMDEAAGEIDNRLARLRAQRETLLRTHSKDREHSREQEVKALRIEVSELRRRKKAYQEATNKRRATENELPIDWTDPAPPDDPACLPLRPLQSARNRAMALAGEEWPGLLLWLKRFLMGNRLLDQLRDETDGLTTSLPAEVREDVHARVYGSDNFVDVARTLTLLRHYRTWIDRRCEERDALASFQAALGEASAFEDRLTQLKEKLSDCFQDLLATVWIGRLVRNLPEVERGLREYFDAINDTSSRLRKRLDRRALAIQRLGEYFPVWIVTNLSARNALPLRAGLFDLVIVDEASQCDIASAVPLLYRARRSAIIGDPKQLQHITSITEEQQKRLVRRSNVDDQMPHWSYVGQSLYTVAERALDEQKQEPTFLNKHYRCHPEIISFSNKNFYGGQLENQRSDSSFNVPPEWRGVRWFDIQGEVPPTTRSAYNEAEIDAVLELLYRWAREGLLLDAETNETTAGVVTPFRAQADRLQERVQAASWWSDLRRRLDGKPPVTVGTAHRFQGDEKLKMIFSPVVAPGIHDYTANWVARKVPQLLNVAVTRAQASLQVVGHLDYCRRVGHHLGSFANHVAQFDRREGIDL